jgi:GNAT superfamily N-acetyltransferase
MKSAMPELLVKSPGECSNIEIVAFIAFVRAGGEVSIQGLVERIRSAAVLVFARVDGLVIGVAALKQPQASYRRRVSSESGAPLPAAEFPYELGWVYVSPESRGKGISLLLSQAIIAASEGACMFATSRTDNVAMHRSLTKVGFVAVGNPFVSGRGKHSLQVFVRHAAQPIIPPDLSRQAAPVR